VADLPSAAGDASTFNITTNGLGFAHADNRRAPATWKWLWVFSPVAACDGQTVKTDVHFVDDDIGLLCSITTDATGTQSGTGNVAPDFVFSPNRWQQTAHQAVKRKSRVRDLVSNMACRCFNTLT